MTTDLEWGIAAVICFIFGWILPMGIILWVFSGYCVYKMVEDKSFDESKNNSENSSKPKEDTKEK